MSNEEKTVLIRRKAGGGASTHPGQDALQVKPTDCLQTKFPLFGMFADCKNLVDEFMANKRFEKELEL